MSLQFLKKMKHLLTLSFKGHDQAYEEEFREFFYDSSLQLFRWGFIIGIVLYSLFGLLDALSVPEQKEEIWFIRYTLVCPLLFLGVLYSYHPSFRRYWQAVTALLITGAGLGVIAMLVIIPPPTRYTYYVGLLLVIFYGTAFINMRFLWASATAIFLIAAFEVVSFALFQVPLDTFLQQNFFALTTLIIGLFTAYSKEFSYRRNFLLLRRLYEEKAKVSQKHKELQRLLHELKSAHNEIKTLSGLIPICSRCKKIRDDQGYWNQLESYLTTHSDVSFSHSICPECARELYGGEKWFVEVDQDKEGGS